MPQARSASTSTAGRRSCGSRPSIPVRSAARQVRIRQSAIGVNFIDTYDRSGLYPVSLPSGIGREAAGVVLEAGKGVTKLRAGDRVAYAGNTPGRVLRRAGHGCGARGEAAGGVSEREAAAIMLKGLTAWFLLRRCHRVRRGTSGPAARGRGRRRADRAAVGSQPSARASSPSSAATRRRRSSREHGAAEVIVSCAREHRRARARDHAQARRAGRLRRRRQGHFLRLARLPRTARTDGELWQRLGRRAAGRAARADEPRLAVPHAADAVPLHGEGVRARARRARTVRRRWQRQGESAGRPGRIRSTMRPTHTATWRRGGRPAAAC